MTILTITLHCDNKYEIRAFATHHWRTAVSTTLSFLTTKRILAKTRNVLNSYCKVNAILGNTQDTSIWMSMSKFNVLNPFKTIKCIISNREYFFMFADTWIHCWKQILLGKKWKLWIPIPPIATHMEKNFLSPCIMWKEESRAIEQSLLRKQDQRDHPV